jgi:hypothetical protein
MHSTKGKLSWVEWIRYSKEAGEIIKKAEALSKSSTLPYWSIDCEIIHELGRAYREYKKKWEKEGLKGKNVKEK